MSIELECPGCGRTLRVDEQFAGSNARCPVCSALCQVPEPGLAAGAGSPPREPMEVWQLQTPDGLVYGPVAQGELEQWVREGRVTADCLVGRQDQSGWQDAGAVYPALTHEPSHKPKAEKAKRYRYAERNRGTLILTLGILSWLVGCPVFGLLAWVMGSADLREMLAGRMDPSGQSATQAGQVLGLIHVLLSLVLAVVGLFLGLARVAGF